MDIVSAYHCTNIGQRPIGDLAAVGECGQIGFCVGFVVQLQCTGHDGHCFLSRDGRVRGHCRRTAPVITAHLDSHCHIIEIPFFGFGHVRVLGNVGFHVAAERPVDDCSHLRACHVAIGVDDGCALAVKQSVIHGRRHGFGVPCSTVIVAEICGLAVDCVCCRRADCQR